MKVSDVIKKWFRPSILTQSTKISLNDCYGLRIAVKSRVLFKRDWRLNVSR